METLSRKLACKQNECDKKNYGQLNFQYTEASTLGFQIYSGLNIIFALFYDDIFFSDTMYLQVMHIGG